MGKILVVDDDPHILRTLEIMLLSDGHTVRCVTSAEQALESLKTRHFDIGMLDLKLPGMDGLALLRRIREAHSDMAIIIITAHGTIETAVEAIKEGAFDYLTKPFSPDQVRHRLTQIQRVSELRLEVSGLRRKLREENRRAEFITESPAMRSILGLARAVAETDATVLVQGESGTGKGRLARLIHQWSRRQDRPFAVVDCTAFHESLLESELFGHKKGAFTGAAADKPGKVEMAKDGTLFLDEVGEVRIDLQAKLLRLVEEQTFERLGDPAPRTVDARIIAATNRDLAEMAAENLFRKDLFFRLSVMELMIPPLRNRPEDIPLLARHFVDRARALYNKPALDIGPEVDGFLVGYSWPGNVREMAHVMERAVLVCHGRMLNLSHLPGRILDVPQASSQSGEIESLSLMEEQHIRKALALGLPLDEIARKLEIDPSTLWRKRKRYNL